MWVSTLGPRVTGISAARVALPRFAQPSRRVSVVLRQRDWFAGGLSLESRIR